MGATLSGLNMNTNGITNCPSIDSNAGQALDIGNATGSTNILGKLTFGSVAGTSGQVLTSTGASTAPTWQTVTASTNITNYQTFDSTIEGFGSYGQTCCPITITIPSGGTATYLLTGNQSLGFNGGTSTADIYFSFVYEIGTVSLFSSACKNVLNNLVTFNRQETSASSLCHSVLPSSGLVIPPTVGYSYLWTPTFSGTYTIGLLVSLPAAGGGLRRQANMQIMLIKP